MKYLLLISSLFIIYLYGCGDDNTTNNGNGTGGETVIFSMDSLTINLTTSVSTVDTILTINNSPNIKITFICSTNADSISSFAFYRFIAFDSSNFFIDTLNNYNSQLNNNHFILINGSNNYNLKILIQMSRSNSIPSFIKLRDIKIIRY